MNFYFKKKFNSKNLSEAEYVRCNHCGLVVSKTHYEMDKEQWQAVNVEAHSSYQGKDECKGDPRWIPRLTNQSNMLVELVNNDIFQKDWHCVDYACGDGKLANMVNQKLNQTWLLKYDKYMSRPNENYLPTDDPKPNSFDLVSNCSMLEHILGKDDAEKIVKLLKDNTEIKMNKLGGVHSHFIH